MSEATTKTTGEPMSAAKNHHIWLEKVAFFARVIAEHPDFESGPIHKAACELESQADELRTILQDQPAPSPQAPGRRKGPPGITLEPQGHEQPAVPEWLNSAFPNSEDLHALGLTAPTPAQFAQQLYKRWKAKLEKVEEELRALKATNAPQPAVPVAGEREKAEADAALYGTGFIVDGWRVAPHRVHILALRPAVEPMTDEVRRSYQCLLAMNTPHGFGDRIGPFVKWLQDSGITAKAEGGAP